MNYLNIIGDTHNTEWLGEILKKYDNLISLGDIAAVDTKEYFKHKEWYGLAWKFYSGKVDKCTKEARQWFKQINVKAWHKQFEQIKKSKRNFILSLGNSDFRMLEFFKECRKEVHDLEKMNLFKCYTSPMFLSFGNIQLLLLPFTFWDYEIGLELKKVDSSKKLFVLGHCPVYKSHKKSWYEFYYKKLKQISDYYKDDFIYIHGHIHSDKTYKYKLKDFKQVTFIPPKATDSPEGFGSYNHLININTLNGKIKIFDLISGEEIKIKTLPKDYRNKPDHWNDFE